MCRISATVLHDPTQVRLLVSSPHNNNIALLTVICIAELVMTLIGNLLQLQP